MKRVTALGLIALGVSCLTLGVGVGAHSARSGQERVRRARCLELATELLRPILASLAAIGAAALGSRLFARHPRLAEVALSLLVR